MIMEKLVLIDGNSLLNRAFYATPVFTTKSGIPTNGVFGFIKLLLKIISDKKPNYLAVAFDVHAPTFRHQKYAEYKAGRKPMPDDLRVQMPILKDVLRLMNIQICEMDGYEADDIIGTLAKRFGVQTFIYTGDRDAYQLVDDTTNVCFTRKGVSDILELSVKNFQDEIGLSPSQIIDLKALMGDKSDNIPGVAGIGEKTALSLLSEYRDLDGIYAHIEETKGATRTKLETGKESAYFSKELATINVHSPIDISIQECLLKMPFGYSVREKFAELEFKSLLSKDIFGEAVSNEGEEKGVDISQKKTIVTEVIPENLALLMEDLKNNQGETIGFDWNEKEIRIFLTSKSQAEYLLPIKESLLDVGFFDYQIVPILQSVFQKRNHIICYNVKDIMHRLRLFNLAFEASYDDVSILKCLSEGLGNTDSLDFCINYYSLPEKNKAYAVYALREEYLQQLSQAEKHLYTNVELPLISVLFNMEKEGVSVDEKVLNELSERYNKELQTLVEKIYELAGEKFNINSTQQLGKILFEKLQIGNGVKKKKESKSYKTTAEELTKYADDSEIIRCLLRYRKIQKINSTYIEGFKPLIAQGKVHTTYNQSNTQTGRLSSANPNLQNIPIRTEEGKELRRLFTASKDNVLIDADYSQIELRLLAHFSECKELIEAYRTGKDIHAITAAQVFNIPIENVTDKQRREAKAVNFGIIYGISAFGLASDLGISTKKAQEYIDRYFETYSSVKTYLHGNIEKANNSGAVSTLLGRKRVINEIKASNYNVRSFGERAAMNMPLQGSSADIIKIAMINTSKRLEEGKYKAKLVLQVHDELVIDCPKEEAEEVRLILKNEMENAVLLNVPLTVDIGMGENWYESK